jgi:hypothetical protein
VVTRRPFSLIQPFLNVIDHEITPLHSTLPRQCLREIANRLL